MDDVVEAPGLGPGMDGGGRPPLSIIVPTLNEADGIANTLAALAPLRARGVEVVVSDGGSTDGTAQIAAPLADRVVHAERGRASQQNAGAAAAAGGVLLFLHADTRLPEGAVALVLDGLASAGRGWGRFDVRLTGRGPLLRVVERLISARSRLSGIATGDQAIFVRADRFRQVGGFPSIPLMEDVALSRALKRRGPPLCLRAAVLTSSRRWETRGIWRTILLMWRLRLEFWLGADPARLAERYR
ncbi:MAG: glycosyl transferase [Gemmatimonadetes bacterium]|nr:glycosyl transferase [Gemmatimonadota bacterium]